MALASLVEINDRGWRVAKKPCEWASELCHASSEQCLSINIIGWPVTDRIEGVVEASRFCLRHLALQILVENEVS